MRFLHAADLHLGLRVTRFATKNGEVQEARLKALETLARHARDVDFTLIAGDLFDDNHIDGPTSRRAFELLESIRKPVFIIPGNHDPITADSVFTRSPWSASGKYVRVLRTCEPVELDGGVLMPCPLFTKNSLEDPTSWIPPRRPDEQRIRIGLAHGSLKDRPNLPPDDHLIDRYAADEKGLDYLALGHWHGLSRHADRGGVVRTVYPGVHEPMRFRDAPAFATGWSAYSNAADDRFLDDGTGRALMVTLDRAGAAPLIEEIETGHLDWRDETHTLRDEDELGKLIDELALRQGQERQLLRLHLSGTLPARALLRLDELDASLGGGQGGILSRYKWAELDSANLLARPNEDELEEIVGAGIVRRVYERLRLEVEDADPQIRNRAREALLLLYRYTREAIA